MGKGQHACVPRTKCEATIECFLERCFGVVEYGVHGQIDTKDLDIRGGDPCAVVDLRKPHHNLDFLHVLW